MLFFSTAILSINAQSADKQLLVSNYIKDTEAFGQFNQSYYSDEYTVRNLFDNQINNVSYWSELANSGIAALFSKPLPNSICNLEYHVYNPQNTNYNLNIISPNKTIDYNGKLESSVEKINIENCISNATQISTTFDAGPETWTTISEIKLYTNETVVVPPPEPCLPGFSKDPTTGQCVPNPDTNTTRISIINSMAVMDITNSQVLLNADRDTKVVINMTGAEVSDDTEEELEDNQIELVEEEKKDKKGDKN